jgi:RNA polymerase sigma-70 factor, ECF subfamily
MSFDATSLAGDQMSGGQPRNDQETREFLRLLGLHERRLRGFILSLVPNWADGDDIAQDVRIQLWEQFRSYDPSKDFGAWARTIAYYQVLTYRKRQARNRQHVINEQLVEAIAEEVASLSDELEAEQRALADCVEKLPQAKRDLLMHYYSGRYSTREIAAESGRSFDATRQTILRTRLALSDCVSEKLETEDGR